MTGSITVRFVLVRPTNALNMGAVARAMANFGLSDLAVVDPYPARWRLAQSAIYGSETLKKAKLTTLEKAVEDCHLILGTTSLNARISRKTTVTLPALRPWLGKRLKKGGRIAVLFGGEKNGLENTDLALCHALLRIPTVKKAPSMNLGQAAALAAYEFQHLSLEKSVKDCPGDLADGKQLEVLVEVAMQAMKKARYNTHISEKGRRMKARTNFTRWKMNRGDAAWLNGLLTRLTQKHS